MSARQGGGITYILNLFDAQHADNIVIVTSGNISFSGTENVKVLDLGLFGRYPGLRFFVELLFFPIMLKRYQVDVLFCPGGVSFTYLMPSKVKLIAMFRNVLPFSSISSFSSDGVYQLIRNMLLKVLMVITFKRADSVIFISNYASEMIKKIVPLKNSTVIYHGLSDDFFQSDCHAHVSSPSPIKILYVSKFLDYKNQLQLLRAIARHSSLRRYSYSIIGEIGGAYYELCKEFSRKNSLDDVVKFVGPVDYNNLPLVYSSADILLFLSSQENCPNILLESMASGKAVVCSNVQPMPEFGQSAVLYCDPYNIDSIFDSIHEVAKNRLLRIEYGKRARERSMSFSWDATRVETFKHFRVING